MRARTVDNMQGEWIVNRHDPVLVTGAGGFIGRHVVARLVQRGFTDIRCLVRSPSGVVGIEDGRARSGGGGVSVIRGNLLSAADCAAAVEGVRVVFHLAAGTGQSSFPD